MCIGTGYEKVRQDITYYKLQLKISKCMLVNFKFSNFDLEFRILTSNVKFRFQFKVV